MIAAVIISDPIEDDGTWTLGTTASNTPCGLRPDLDRLTRTHLSQQKQPTSVNRIMKATITNKACQLIATVTLAAIAISLCGCASIVDGRTPRISINSSP